MAQGNEWPFEDAPNTAAITTRQVVEKTEPVRLVVRDEDGGWQFLCGTTGETEDGRVVSLAGMLKLDPSLAEVADLPPGSAAEREGPGGEWVEFELEDDEEE
ncbi:MAG: hypothetical protein LW650_11795 [Planctomycetaceae bacterium]|jgi:hypothetical protein|nr:DUF2185 domain-containing protein [Phycisphaerales bacterium]MCE2654112.1 hypothetical protein [Planctomycetaceae bacterium]